MDERGRGPAQPSGKTAREDRGDAQSATVMPQSMRSFIGMRT